MSAGFTPGPWVAGKYDVFALNGGQAIVSLEMSKSKAEDEANANLIAAAPELYDGCAALVGLFQLIEHRGDLPADLKLALIGNHRLNEANRALAKARGQS